MILIWYEWYDVIQCETELQFWHGQTIWKMNSVDVSFFLLNSPGGFWAEAAADISWVRKWHTVLDKSKAPFYRWFSGGVAHGNWDASSDQVWFVFKVSDLFAYDVPFPRPGKRPATPTMSVSADMPEMTRRLIVLAAQVVCWTCVTTQWTATSKLVRNSKFHRCQRCSFWASGPCIWTYLCPKISQKDMCSIVFHLSRSRETQAPEISEV